MRKLLSLLLTLALCIGLIPLTAVPVHAVDTYDVWVGDTRITSENKDAIPSVLGGTASYDPSTHTLTFNGVTGIRGTSTFSYPYSVANTPTDVTVKIGSKDVNLVIEGDVKIDASGVGHGIFVYNGSLTMKTDLTITGAADTCIETYGNGDVYAESGTYNISGRYGVNVYNSFYIKEGVSFTVNATGDDCDGIGSSRLYITNATVDATGTESGIWTDGYHQTGGTVKTRGGEEGLWVGNSTSDGYLEVSGNATLESWSGDGHAALFSYNKRISLSSSYVYIKEPSGGYVENVSLNGFNPAVVVDSNGTVATHALIAPKPTNYNLWVAGIRLNSDNLVIDSTDNAAITSGTATYVPATRTLTLNNFVFEGAGYKEPDYHYYSAIYNYYDDPLTIELIGTNSLSETGAAAHTNETYNNSYGIHADCDVTFIGSGTLTAKGGKASQVSRGLYINGVLTVPSSFTGTITGKVDDAAGSTCACYGILANVATIENGTINAIGPSGTYGDSFGLSVGSDATGFTLSGGTLTATGKTKAVSLPSSNYHITGYAEASTSIDGSNPDVFDISKMGTYLWFHYPTSLTPAILYDLYVGDVQVTSANKDNVLNDTGTPTVKYDPSTATLYLKDANINTFYNHGSNDSSAIYTKSSLTINLSGDNTISVVNAPENNDVHGIDLDEDGLSLTIEGDGSLDILCGASGFHSATCIDLWPYSGIRNKVTICDSAKVKAELVKGNSTFGAISVTGDVVLCDNAQLTVMGGDSNRGSLALSASFSVLVKDNAVLIAVGGSNAPESGSESVSSIAVKCIDMTVQDNAVVAATGGTVKASDDAQSIGIQVNPNKLIINGGTVAANTKATQGKAQALSSAPVLASGMVAGGSVNSDGSGAVEYVAADNDTYKWFKTPFTIVPKADTPVFSPAATSFTETIDVTITCALTGATVYYTDDGSTPSATNGTVTTGAAITLTETKTLKAIAVMAGYDDSDIATATYTKTTPSSGGGSTPAPETYAVTPGSAENGKITASPKDAAEGDKVTVTVTPDEGYELDTLTVKDKDGNEIKVTEKDGVYTFTMPASEVDIEATFKEAEEEPAPADDFPFVDVPEDAYYRDAVEWAVETGVTGGTSPTTFSPKKEATRGQTMTFLWAAAGAPEPKTTVNPFKDISEDDYYYKAILWAYENGITAGISAEEFGPEVTVTRAQVATFLYGIAGRPDTGSEPFADVNDGDYFALPVAWAFGEGITSGTSETTFSPDADCLREQIITFMYLYFAE